MAEYQHVRKVVSDPVYATGGMEIVIDGLAVIDHVQIHANPSQFLEADDTVYSISYTKTGDNKIKVVIKTLDVTGTSPVSWTELAGGTALTGVELIIDAWGY